MNSALYPIRGFSANHEDIIKQYLLIDTEELTDLFKSFPWLYVIYIVSKC